MNTLEERLLNYAPFFGTWHVDDLKRDVLGRGNSGTVYLIHDGEVDAALKVIPIPTNQAMLRDMQKRSNSEEEVRALIDQELEYVKTEIRIMEQLKATSHIVCFEDYQIYKREDTYGYDVLIRMERLLRLDQFLRDPMKFGIRPGTGMILRIWYELVEGLCLCERCGIAHLDIKPENIFYAEPSRDFFKLGDFGVSIRAENGKKQAEGMRVGTYDYMAPEVYAYKGGDSYSDMYSLGIVIYRLLNNDRLPFMSNISNPTEDDYTKAWNRRLEKGEDVPPIKGLDPALSAILMRCLRRNPEDRYPSMKDLRDDISRYMLGAGTPKPRKGLPIVLGITVVGVLAVMTYIGLRIFGAETEHKFSLITKINDRVGPNQEYTYSGEAEPGEKIQVYLNMRRGEGAPYATPVADENGKWTVTLKEEDLKRNEGNTVNFYDAYNDRADNMPNEFATFTYDDTAMLSFDDGYDTVTPNQPIKGKVEENATVELWVNGGETKVDGSVDEYGDFTIETDDIPKSQSLSYLVVTIDQVGNRRDQDVKVVFDNIRLPNMAVPIEMGSKQGMNEVDGYYTVNAQGQNAVFNLNGEKEKNIAVTVSRDGESYGEPFSVLPGVDMELPEEDGEYTYHFEYEDDNSIKLEITVLVDRTVPEVTLRTVPFAEQEAALVIETEPDATITVTDSNGAVVFSEQQADEEGVCTLPAYTYAHEEYTIQAEDRAGNRSEPQSFTPYMPIRVTSVENMTLAENGEYHVNAADIDGKSPAFVVEGEEDLTIRISRTSFGKTREARHFSGYKIDVPPNDGRFVYEMSYEGVGDGAPTMQVVVEVDVTPPSVELVELPVAGHGTELSLMTEPGTRVEVYDPQNVLLFESQKAGDDGICTLESYTYDLAEYTVRATDSFGNETVLPFTPELFVEVDNNVNTYSAALEITTVPGAEIEVTRDGQAAEGMLQAQANGRFTWTPAEGFVLGDSYTVIATAEGQRKESEPVVVQRMPLTTEITLELSGVSEDGSAAGLLRAQGTAQPGATVTILWNGRPSQPVAVDEDGHYEADLDAQAFDLPATGETGRITVTYEDGLEGEPTYDYDGEIFWDGYLAETAVDPLSEEDTRMRVTTEPEATVYVRQNGEELDHDTANKEGVYIWEPDQVHFTLDAEYEVTSVDASGNSTTVSVVVQSAKRAEIQITGETRRKKTLILKGTAESGKRLRATWNGQEQGAVEDTANENGIFTLSLNADDCGLSSEPEDGVLRVSYADGIAQDKSAEEIYTWDAYIVLTVDPVNEDDGVLTVHTDAGAEVTVKQGSRTRASGNANEDGVYEWEAGVGAFTAGKTLTINADDGWQHTERKNVKVGASTLTPLELETDPKPVETERRLTFKGTGEPGTKLRVYVNGEERSPVTVANTGSFSIHLNKKDYEVPYEGADFTLRVAYDGDVGRSLAREYTFRWDAETRLEIDELYEDSGELVVHTDPNASVTITSEDGREQTVSADAEGVLRWPAPANGFVIGEKYTVQAVDESGNKSNRTPITVQESQRQQIEITVDEVITGSSISVTGTAEPKQALTVAWGNVKKTATASRSGKFSAKLDVPRDLPSEGETRTLTVSYADGKGQKSWAEQSVTCDTWADIQVNDALSEDSTAIKGQADPYSTVYLESDVYSDEQTTGKTGEFSFAPGYPFTFAEGDVYTLHAVDPNGNASDPTPLVVQETSRAYIVLYSVPVVYNEDVLTIFGGAEPGKSLYIALYNEKGDKVYEDSIQVDDDGTFTHDIAAADCALSSKGSTIEMQICYADFVGAISGSRVVWVEPFLWDNTPPTLTIDQKDAIDGHATEVTGQTEDESDAVSVTIGGKEAAVERNGTRYTASTGEAFQEGDRIVVRSVDHAGNESLQETVVLEASDWEIGEVEISGSASLTTADALELTGWYAYNGDSFEQYTVELCRITDSGATSFAKVDKTEMNSRQVSTKKKAWSKSADVSEGYTFKNSVNLANLPSGVYTVSLARVEWSQDNKLVYTPFGKSVEFEVHEPDVEETEDVEVQPNYKVFDEEDLEYPFAAGVDDGYVLDGDELFLTGWIYSGEGTSYSILGVELEGGPGPGLDLPQIERKTIDEMPVYGWTMVNRDVSRAVPDDVRRQLSSIETPRNEDAGFVIYLNDFNLMAGVPYTIKVDIAQEGKMETLKIPQNFTKGSGDQITRADVDAAIADWLPSEGAEGEAEGN